MDYGKRFSFLVPVLQWHDSFINSHWQQLQNEPLPYGWKDQPFHGKVTVNTSSIPVCVVLWWVTEWIQAGKTIDSHDYVFRVNGAVIQGFEDDVGTKTAFYGFSTKNSIMAYYQDGFNKVPHDPGSVDDRYGKVVNVDLIIKTGPQNFLGYNPEPHQFKMIDPSFNMFLKFPRLEQYRDLYMPSTGALMLLVALYTCDQVSAYGFITENYKDFSDHYFDKVMKPLVFYANHDMKMEGHLWKQLHSQKVLWLYQRNLGTWENLGKKTA
uniref:alpha-N-acetylgalactosaminide alpha-2,6-sialyltransferase n=1 Tax=Sinocyclocheilus anshuiensis TaxID=1608454 RepID=A0A671PV25_9TELE